MSDRETDDQTGYGHDQDREPSGAGRSGAAGDGSPDDPGPESIGGSQVNPATGAEYGQVDNSPDPPH